jgi:hypothetical protein
VIFKSLSAPAGILDLKTSSPECGTRNTVQVSPSIHPLSREERFPSLPQQNSLFQKLLEYPNKATNRNQTSHYQRPPPAIVEYPHLQFLFSFGVAPSSREKCRPTSLIMLINHFQIIENKTHLSQILTASHLSRFSSPADRQESWKCNKRTTSPLISSTPKSTPKRHPHSSS